MNRFINCSNHPSSGWLDEQLKAAELYGEIVDVEFPIVPVTATEQELNELVNTTFQKIIEYSPNAVMCMGEFVVCYRLVMKLKEQGIKVLASCSERESREYLDENGQIKKESLFVFKGFREY